MSENTESDRAGFLQAICADPADDTHRLVYADFLQEHGDPDRAEFIRVQCALAAARRDCSCGACVAHRGGGQHTNGGCAAARLKWNGDRATVREFTLWDANKHVWEVTLPSGGDLGPRPAAVWRRGFLDEVSLGLGLFINSAARLFAHHPVTRVLATDRTPLPNMPPNAPQRSTFSWSRGLGISGMIVSGLQWEIPAPLWDNELAGSYWTRRSALLALSNRLVDWGRAQAGLPNLRR